MINFSVVLFKTKSFLEKLAPKGKLFVFLDSSSSESFPFRAQAIFSCALPVNFCCFPPLVRHRTYCKSVWKHCTKISDACLSVLCDQFWHLEKEEKTCKRFEKVCPWAKHCFCRAFQSFQRRDLTRIDNFQIIIRKVFKMISKYFWGIKISQMLSDADWNKLFKALFFQAEWAFTNRMFSAWLLSNLSIGFVFKLIMHNWARNYWYKVIKTNRFVLPMHILASEMLWTLFFGVFQMLFLPLLLIFRFRRTKNLFSSTQIT